MKKLHYEGDGIYSKDMKQAKKILDNLIYNGERPPTMDWIKFEQQLNSAFAAYVRNEKREVHSNDMKITILQDKIKCDDLISVNAACKWR